MTEYIQTQQAVVETEDTITIGRREFDATFRNRMEYDRQKVLDQAIRAWRTNPLARRIIEITTQFVIGDGISFTVKNKRAEKFLKSLWEHPVNRLADQLPEWADECWRSGDLFLLASVDGAGVSYLRALPAELVTDIIHAPNDYRTEVFYKVNDIDEPLPAYIPGADQKKFVLHFALTRAAGAYFGESDLAPVLYWIGLYKQWLEDRARLNYFRQLFAFLVQKPFTSPEEKEKYLAKLRADMPKPGSVKVVDPDELWGTLNPQLASFEAEIDGLAIKRMIAAGVGMPLHFLAEPESSTKSTAEAAGTPTYKRFESRQLFFTNALKRTLEVCYEVRRQYDTSLPREVDVTIAAPDISERDNAGLAIASSTIAPTFEGLYNAGLIDEQEYVRVVYQFAGQTPPETIPTNPIARVKPVAQVGSTVTGDGASAKSKVNVNDEGDVTIKGDDK